MRTSALSLFASAVLFAAPPSFEDIAKSFEYDRRAPIDLKTARTERGEGATVSEFSYASPRGGRVPATLVVPGAKGPFAAILFGHWMMPGSPLRNRGEFLEEALVLARSGVVSLMIDAPYVRPGFVTDDDPFSPQDGLVAQQQVIDFRRGVDILAARPDVDPARIAYVGHSFDAKVGTILAAVEKRIGSFVLMAGALAGEEYVLESAEPNILELRKKYGDERIREHFRKNPWDDPIHFMPHSAPAAVFLQYGRKDAPIPEAMARRNFERFAQSKKLAFYDAGHELNAEARRDRAEWLAARLKLRSVDYPALARIPPLK